MVRIAGARYDQIEHIERLIPVLFYEFDCRAEFLVNGFSVLVVIPAFGVSEDFGPIFKPFHGWISRQVLLIGKVVKNRSDKIEFVRNGWVVTIDRICTSEMND